MAAADVQTCFNALPHIDALIKGGVRRVQDNLPELPGTLWTLKHKHFDLEKEEVLRFEVRKHAIKVTVIKKSETENLHPCQAFYDNGEWKVIGYATSACQLTIPKQEGSGMITSELKEGQLREVTDEEARIQVLKEVDEVISKKDPNIAITAMKDKTMSVCHLCSILTDCTSSDLVDY